MFPPLHLYSFQIIAKLIIIFFQLFKINKNIQDTLPLRVTRNGTKILFFIVYDHSCVNIVNSSK